MAFTYGVDSSGDCLKGTQQRQSPDSTTAFTQTFKANSLRAGKTHSNQLKSKHALNRNF